MEEEDGGTRLVSLKELAKYLKRTPRRLIQLVDEGILPRSGRGQYPLLACVNSFIAYLDSQIDGRSNKSEMVEEKLLSARLERRKRELELAQIESQLITVEAHERSIAEALTLVRRNLRNLPGSVAPRLIGYDDARDIVEILAPAVDEAMRAIVAEAERRIEDQDLPEDLPGRRQLLEFGIKDLPSVVSLPDLLIVPGIGPKRALAIEKWIKERIR